MSSEFRDRLFVKCLKIYERKESLSLWPVNRFLKRLDIEWSLQSDLWDNYFIPEIRRRYFSGMTVDLFLKESILLYRSSSFRSSALIKIWNRLDWEIPFTNDEYEEFVERFEEMLKNESNPPTREDWDELDENLRK